MRRFHTLLRYPELECAGSDARFNVPHRIAAKIALLLTVATIAWGEPPQDPSQQPAVAAQVAKPLDFEVASIKPTSPEFRGSRAFAPTSRNNLNLQGMTLKDLIQLAYTLSSDFVGGGPGWVDGARYDIEAKAEGRASQQQRRKC
jgi:hypothetical protein